MLVLACVCDGELRRRTVVTQERRPRGGLDRREDVREQRRGDSVAEQSKEADKGGNGRAEATAAGEKAAKEGEGAEEEGEQEEDPAEAREQEELVVGARVAASNAGGDVLGVLVPGVAKGHGGRSTAAVRVALAADVEVGPLANVIGAIDALGVGLEEVGLVEGGAVGNTGEDDEEEEQKGGSHHYEADEAEGGVCEDWLALCLVLFVASNCRHARASLLTTAG